MDSTIKIIFNDPNLALNSHKDIIKDAYTEAINMSAKLLGIKNVQITVNEDKSNVIPEVGVGGYTPSKNTINLYIDSSKAINKEEVYNTLCHELHHAKRFDGPGYGITLFDSIIFEGLACCFEQEVQKGESFFIDKISKYNDVHNLIKANAKAFKNKNFNYQEWFITGNKNLPRWAGYIMGYYITKQYIKDTNKTVAELALIDPKELYKYIKTFKLS